MEGKTFMTYPIETRINVLTLATLAKHYHSKTPGLTRSGLVRTAIEDFVAGLVASGLEPITDEGVALKHLRFESAKKKTVVPVEPVDVEKLNKAMEEMKKKEES